MSRELARARRQCSVAAASAILLGVSAQLHHPRADLVSYYATAMAMNALLGIVALRDAWHALTSS